MLRVAVSGRFASVPTLTISCDRSAERRWGGGVSFSPGSGIQPWTGVLGFQGGSAVGRPPTDLGVSPRELRHSWALVSLSVKWASELAIEGTAGRSVWSGSGWATAGRFQSSSQTFIHCPIISKAPTVC